MVHRGFILSLLLLVGCSAEPPSSLGGPPLIRQLNDAQYRAIIADVFSPEIPVVGRLPDGLRIDGLKAIGSSEMSMSAVDIEQYDKAARSVAAAVVSDQFNERLLGCAAPSDMSCVKAFLNRYGEKLLRRPLTDTDLSTYETIAQNSQNLLNRPYVGVQYALHALLMSPDFILRFEMGESEAHPSQLTDFEKASRLSFFLTNSAPDDLLINAARQGELSTKQGLEKHIDRLMGGPYFKRAMRAFFEDMLEFELFDSLAKDTSIYAAYSSQLMDDAREQTLKTLVDHLIVKERDYRDIFTTRESFLTRPLGVVYRLPVATRNGWEKVTYPLESQRKGILTDISFLGLHSHPGRSSATLRGMALREIFLCQETPDPPANVNFAVVQDPSNDHLPTAKDRLVAHRTEPSCSGCHKIMDPIGLGFENFDGLGGYRVLENGAEIDATGDFDGIAFTSIDELTKAMRNHPEVPRCFVEKMYRFAVGRDTTWDERHYMDSLLDIFVDDGYRLKSLVRSIAMSDQFYAVNPSPITISHEPGFVKNL